mmetsp:Transcript_21711/g.51298  ORF Transcript_21711/g.51298 Transcript_21711/m.51298 type:complete len:203 (-) Transcript_21711:308-916(-)
MASSLAFPSAKASAATTAGPSASGDSASRRSILHPARSRASAASILKPTPSPFSSTRPTRDTPSPALPSPTARPARSARTASTRQSADATTPAPRTSVSPRTSRAIPTATPTSVPTCSSTTRSPTSISTSWSAMASVRKASCPNSRWSTTEIWPMQRMSTIPSMSSSSRRAPRPTKTMPMSCGRCTWIGTASRTPIPDASGS